MTGFFVLLGLLLFLVLSIMIIVIMKKSCIRHLRRDYIKLRPEPNDGAINGEPNDGPNGGPNSRPNSGSSQ